MQSREQLTQQLREAAAGDEQAQEQVFHAVEPQLREIARSLLRKESQAQSMQTTMLIDDAFMKFLGNPEGANISNRLHFLRLIKKYIHQLLVDAARARRAKKRGAGKAPLELDEQLVGSDESLSIEITKFELLDKLRETRAPADDVLLLREFGEKPQEYEDIAALLDISVDEVEALHRYGLAWIKRELSNVQG